MIKWDIFANPIVTELAIASKNKQIIDIVFHPDRRLIFGSVAILIQVMFEYQLEVDLIMYILKKLEGMEVDILEIHVAAFEIVNIAVNDNDTITFQDQIIEFAKVYVARG